MSGEPLRVLDLFCGALGGWSLGLHRAGFQTVAACEIDPWRRAVFSAQHPGARMYADARELTAKRLKADLGYLPEIVVGSPPCQEVSGANSKGAGITDDHLFWEWARLVFEVRPLWCAAENSPRARTKGIDGILDALEAARYAWWPVVVGADHAGANHLRRRLWLVGADADRLELWKQQQWMPRRWTGRVSDQGEAVVGRDGPDADGKYGAPGRPLRRSAEQGGGDTRGHDAGDATRQRRAEGLARAEEQPSGGHASGSRDARHAALEPGLRQPGVFRRGRTKSARAGLSHAADAAGAGCKIGPGGGNGPKLPPALRNIGLAWPDWNGGLAGLAAACAAAGFGALDDGGTAGLSTGLRNRAIAALGDAVVADIPEAIGRAILAAQAMMKDAA